MVLRKKTCCMSGMVAGVAMLFLVSCGDNPEGIKNVGSGSIEMQIQVTSRLGKHTTAKKTGFDSLIVDITADDIEPYRYSRPVDPEQVFIKDTIQGVPVGTGRHVSVMTVNTAGEVIHEDSVGEHVVIVEPNVIAVISAMLVPLRGSIYVQLGEIPTSVDSLVAIFIDHTDRAYRTSAARSPKVSMSLDGILHLSRGTLIIAGITIAGDTLFKATKECTIDVRSGTSLHLSFEGSPGSVAISGELVMPGVTLVSGSLGDAPSVASERGDLIITEIMYAAQDSEYIEVYNPAEQRVAFDSLAIDVDGVTRFFTGVVVEGGGYYVLGRSAVPWVDITHTVKSALDLSSNGNWITLLTGDGEVIDQVVFCGGNNELEWPRLTGKQSLCLKGDMYDCTANNFGRNWYGAFQEIEGTQQRGTPHNR